MRILLFLLLSLFCGHFLKGGIYNWSQLPDSIKRNASAVVWNFDQDISINRDLSFTVHYHKVISILNSSGADLAIYTGYESKEMSSHLIKGIIYDANGSEFKKIKKSDLNTVGEYSQFISDVKEDYYNPQLNSFPYTVEYEYETKYDYLLYLPDFDPYQDYNTSVISSTYKISSPSECAIRWYAQNCTWKPVVESKDNLTTYTFTLQNAAAIRNEPGSPEFNKIAPKVLLAPGKISYYGYKNKFENWNDFGDWILQLNKGRDSLTADVKLKMHQYKETYPDVIERAKAIYTWMQDNTRYYSIQLGLGGFQPMKTLDVNKNKYGDCKALSFYTQTLFKEAGIPAYYTLVMAGKNKSIVPGMPANQFNHAILCMPMKNDTIWLECTDQKTPFGFIGDFTDDRDVLVINEHPSIAHTKCYTQEENISSIKANVLMSNGREISGDLTYHTGGLQFEKLYTAEYLPSKDLREKYLYSLLNVNNLQVNNYSFKDERTIIPQKSFLTSFEIGDYLTRIGSKLMFEPNIFSKFTSSVKADSARRLPIEQPQNYTETDSLTFFLPNDFIYAQNSTPVELNTAFGNYFMQMVYQKESNTILYTRKLMIRKGIFPPSSLKEYVSFINKVISYDRAKVILQAAH